MWNTWRCVVKHAKPPPIGKNIFPGHKMLCIITPGPRNIWWY